MEQELKSFMKDLKTIENSIYRGMASNTFPLENNFFNALKRFSKNLNTCFDIVALIDSHNKKNTMLNKYNPVVAKHDMRTMAAKILVILNTEKYRENKSEFTVEINNLFKTMAEDIIELKTVLETLQKEYIDLHKDDEIFQPENVDKDKIIFSLDSAIRELEKNTEIDPNYKKNILIYINEIKIDINKENPPWSTIIGKLDIASIIITIALGAGPIATFISDAYKEIVGKNFSTVHEQKTIYKIDSNIIDIIDYRKVKTIEHKQLGIKKDSDDIIV